MHEYVYTSEYCSQPDTPNSPTRTKQGLIKNYSELMWALLCIVQGFVIRHQRLRKTL